MKYDRLQLFKETILHGSDCLTLTLLTRYLLEESYHEKCVILRATSLFRKYHVFLGYFDKKEFKTFNLGGSKKDKKFKVIDDQETLKLLEKTKPIIHFVNTKIRKKY